MIFEINFNKETDDKTLEKLGAKLVSTGYFNKYPPFEVYQIEINTPEELEDLLKKVDSIKKESFYSAIISFDPPTIYLDNKI